MELISLGERALNVVTDNGMRFDFPSSNPQKIAHEELFLRRHFNRPAAGPDDGAEQDRYGLDNGALYPDLRNLPWSEHGRWFGKLSH